MGWGEGCGKRCAGGEASEAARTCHTEAVGACALVVGQLGGVIVGQLGVGRAAEDLDTDEGGQVHPGGEPRDEEEEEARLLG